MRITRNYLSSLLGSGSGVYGQPSLLQQALSRSKSRKTVRNSALLNSLSKTSGPLGQTAKTAGQTQKFYANMKYHAGQAADYAGRLTDRSDGSVFAKAKESGDNAEVLSQIESFVTQYNHMIGDLRESGSRTDMLYLTQLNSLSGMDSLELASCGVGRSADGTLTVDRDKLAATDLETLEKVWNRSGGFADKAADWADSVEAGAERNRQAEASSLYGNRLNPYMSSNTNGSYFNWLR